MDFSTVVELLSVAAPDALPVQAPVVVTIFPERWTRLTRDCPSSSIEAIADSCVFEPTNVVFVSDVFGDVYVLDAMAQERGAEAISGSFLASIHQALKPAGRLVVIEGRSPPSSSIDKVTVEQIRVWTESAGFRLVDDRDYFEPHRYVHIYERTGTVD